MSFRSTLVAVSAAAMLQASATALHSQQADLASYVDSLASSLIDSAQVAGVSVGVMRGAETLLFETYGYADLEFDVPMPEGAVHEIGSITKQFTAAAVLKLWEQGKIDLDADVTEYLPQFDTQGHEIPLRRLFDHTSGMRGYTEMDSFDAIGTEAHPRDSLVTLIGATPFDFAPGEALIYNNSGYFLLGLIIEEVSGQSYEEYLEENIFGPLGMDDSSYCSSTAIVPNRAHGYDWGPEGLQLKEYLNHLWPYAAGSLCSTVGDQLTWLRAFHGERVLSPEAYRMMITPRALPHGATLRYAMGLVHMTTPAGRVIMHGGGIPGYQSASRYYPDDDLSVVVLINTNGPPGPAWVADQIAERLLGHRELPVSTYRGDLGALEGTYEGQARGRRMTQAVRVDADGVLTSGDGDDRNVISHREGTTFASGTTHYTFVVEGGRAAELHVDHATGHYVLRRIGR